MTSKPTRRLVYLALLISLSVVLTRVASINIPFEGIVTLRIGFGPLPVIIAGLLFGPYYGALVGVLGDIIGFNLNPMGPYLPHFTIISGLHGFLPPLIWFLTGKRVSFWSLLAVIAVTQLATALTLTPYVLQTVLGIPLIATMPGRIASQVFIIPLYAILTRKILIASRFKL